MRRQTLTRLFDAGQVYVSRHVQERALQRRISKEAIDKTLRHGKVEISSVGRDTKYAVRLGTLCVIVAFLGTAIEVVTAFHT